MVKIKVIVIMRVVNMMESLLFLLVDCTPAKQAVCIVDGSLELKLPYVGGRRFALELRAAKSESVTGHSMGSTGVQFSRLEE